MIEILVIGALLLISLLILRTVFFALKKQHGDQSETKIYFASSFASSDKVKKSPPSLPVVRESLISVTYLTAKEARQRSRELRNHPNCTHSEVLLPKGAPERFRDPEVLFDELEAIEEFEEALYKVQEEIASSQQNSLGRGKMIPLCVSFVDKQKVKDRGASWCPETKTWFWPFAGEHSSMEEWLPLIYLQKSTPPYIYPILVPKNLWGINLRNLLPREQWDKIRKDIYKKYAYRCSVCGCKGQKWPVECDEMWTYDTDQQRPWRGTVIFSGLVALCPGCHQAKHFGKACVDGEENLAIARMCYLNGWSNEQVYQQAYEANSLWKERSEMEWVFDFSLLKEKYGIELVFDPVKPVDFEEKSGMYETPISNYHIKC